MEPARIDYEVRTLAGRLVYTSGERDLAIGYADAHCGRHYPLFVEQIAIRREIVHTAARRLGAA